MNWCGPANSAAVKEVNFTYSLTHPLPLQSTVPEFIPDVIFSRFQHREIKRVNEAGGRYLTQSAAESIKEKTHMFDGLEDPSPLVDGSFYVRSLHRAKSRGGL